MTREARKEKVQMTKAPPRFLRIGNSIVTALLQRGIKMGSNTLLTVPGRKSGEPRTTPVTVLNWNGQRLLASPYGEVDWVRNLRAAGEGSLRHGRDVETITAVELSPAEAAPIYKETLSSYPAIIQGYFDVSPESPLEAFEREAERHPMFRLRSAA
jgi:deazaflavin-dependent oxidoreductase (nitroreductase family)